MKRRKWMALPLAAVLAAVLAVMLAVTSLAAGIDPAGSSPAVSGSYSWNRTESEAELLMAYFDRESGMAEPQGITVSPRSDGLSGNDKLVYDYLLGQIKEIAAGKIASTVIEVPFSLFGLDWEHEYTDKELGFDGCVTYDPASDKWVIDNDRVAEAFEAFCALFAFDTQKVFDALEADCPYELYWMGSGEGAYSYVSGEYGYGTTHAGGTARAAFYLLTEYAAQYTFKPGAGYKGSADNTVDTAKTKAASASAAEAKSVVMNAKELSDYDKLLRYKEYICEAVSYNDEARDHINDIDTWGQSDPWQLIWVFDGDPDTNVVCEGYSKAFQYLCDLTAFDDPQIDCISPTGQMDGGTGAGPHMWNLVTMEDGNRYLVDVTNSDEGTVGGSDPLFLKGYTAAAYPTYTYTASGQSIDFTYDDETQARYTAKELEVSASDYRPQTAAAPSFKTKSLTLGGDIGVNFFLDLSCLGDDEKADSYVEFTVNGKTTKAAYDGSFMNTAKTYYGFTCYVSSIQFGSKIDAVYHYGDKTVEEQYAVMDYIKSYEKIADAYPAKTTDLVRALQDYGHYAREYLNSIHEFGNEYAASPAYNGSYTLSDRAEVKSAAGSYAFKAEKNGDIDAVTYALYLDSKTSIAVYVKPKEGYTGTVSASGYPVTRQADGRYMILIKDIAAHELGTKKTVTITTESGTAAVTVCPLSLCNSILNGDYDTAAQDLAVSLYKYWAAAAAYKS